MGSVNSRLKICVHSFGESVHEWEWTSDSSPANSLVMDRHAGIQQIRKSCDIIAAELLRIHPAVRTLNDQPTQDDLVKALYRLTVELETVKKRVLKLEKQEDTTLL
jgi:hypothetical protein